MSSHRFAEGQVILVPGSRFPTIKRGEHFKVVRLLPPEGTTPQYRIQSELNGHERIVREDEIDAVP